MVNYGELALPNEHRNDYNIINDCPAYITDAPAHAGRSLEGIDLNHYWTQPNETIEEPKPDLNGINESVEGIADGVAEAGRRRQEADEILEQSNSDSEYSDSPPDQPQTDSTGFVDDPASDVGTDLNGNVSKNVEEATEDATDDGIDLGYDYDEAIKEANESMNEKEPTHAETMRGLFADAGQKMATIAGGTAENISAGRKPLTTSHDVIASIGGIVLPATKDLAQGAYHGAGAFMEATPAELRPPVLTSYEDENGEIKWGNFPASSLSNKK